MRTPISQDAAFEDEPITEPLLRTDEDKTVEILISDGDDERPERPRVRRATRSPRL
ncbi:MAG: hypothetical protein ACXVDD_10905 [Polyangia bacterium]